MSSYNLYCGKNLITVGGDANDPQFAKKTQTDYYDTLIQECLDMRYPGIDFLIPGNGDDIISLMKNQFIYIESAGGYVLNNVGQSLVIFRNGLWDLPKGKVEPGESVEDAAVREVMEETGITKPEIVKLLTETYHFYRWKDSEDIYFKKTYWYLMNYIGNGKTNPQIEEGITTAMWADDGMIDDMIARTHRNLHILFQFKKDGRI